MNVEPTATFSGDHWSVISQFMSDPLSYRDILGCAGATSVEEIQTSTSSVFLVNDKAFKVRRPVRLPHIDCSHVESRREFARKEQVLNRRTAPELYQGYLPIIRRPDGQVAFARDGEIRYGLGGIRRSRDGEVIEWVSIMRRFGPDELLSDVVKTNRATDQLFRELARTIARFHRDADPVPVAFRSRDFLKAGNQLLSTLRGALVECHESVRDKLAYVAQPLIAEITRVAPVLDSRTAKDVHGDLHTQNVCVVEGEPLLFDCLEYDDFYRQIDPMLDLSFLLMDLVYLRRRDAAMTVLNEYLEVSGDYDGLSLVSVGIAYFATVRAMVEALRPNPDQGRTEAYLDVAMQALDGTLFGDGQVFCVAVGGLSGSGKSTLAAGLSRALGLVHLRTDAIRKRLVRVTRDERAPEQAYDHWTTARTYLAMMLHAIAVMEAGLPVVCDGTFRQESMRNVFTSMFLDQDSETPLLVPLWVSVSPEEAVRRVNARRGDVSDADSTIVEKQLREQHHSTTGPWGLRINGDAPPAAVLHEAITTVKGHISLLADQEHPGRQGG